jgi:hypothetical protein
VKRMFFVIAIIFAAYFPLHANVYVDGFGTYGSYGDAKTMMGFGTGAGVEILPMFNIYAKFMSGKGSEIKNNVTTAEYDYKIFFGEAEYLYRIKELPLMWDFAIGIGRSEFNLHPNMTTGGIEDNESGLFIGAWAGVRYHISQRIGAYALAGYTKSMWTSKADMSKPNVSGLQIQLGITATVWGKNVSIDEDY